MFPDLDHGDEWADAEMLNSARNFVRFGFIKCRFLPFHTPQFDALSQPPYTHFPPLSEILNGVILALFKRDSLYFFRGIAILFSFLNLVFWYLFVKKFSSSFVAFLCALFYLFNPLFIFGADSLSQISYADSLRSAIFFFFVSLIYSPYKKKSILLVALWSLLLLESLMSAEYIIYLSLFFILFRYFFKKSQKIIDIRLIIILISAFIFGLLIHFFQNVWWFGSFSSAIGDLRNISLQSIIQRQDSPMPLSFVNWWNFVIVRYFSLVLPFGYLLLFFLLIFALLLYKNLSGESKEKIKPLFYLSLLLAICGISWYVVFPAQTLAHTFILFLARHLVPVASLISAILCYTFWAYLKENNPGNVYGKIAFALIVIFIPLTGILKSDLPITSAKINAANEFGKFKQCLLNLRNTSNKNDEIGVNYYRSPFMSYYVNRRFRNIFNIASLEKAETFPKYFIFLPYDNPGAKELLQFLNEKYVFLFECDNARFSTLFFKLKAE
jgi:hypothetical protein